jgi:hypothetical protein
MIDQVEELKETKPDIDDHSVLDTCLRDQPWMQQVSDLASCGMKLSDVCLMWATNILRHLKNREWFAVQCGKTQPAVRYLLAGCAGLNIGCIINGYILNSCRRLFSPVEVLR